MRLIPFFILALFFLPGKIYSQHFCFFNPNTGPHYHNGSSGAIYDVTAGDFNNDGHIDIVTANSVGSNISFIPGNGDGTLGSPDTISSRGTLFAINSADLDMDGNLDIVTANHFNILVYYGNGDGTFQNYKTFQSSDSPSRVYLEDLNADNKKDIIIAGGSSLTILLQVNNNNFSFPMNMPAGGLVYDATINYFDADTIKDVVAVVRESPSVAKLAFFKGNSVGNFAMPVLISVPHFSIFGINSMDIDNNGTQDLIVSNSNLDVSRIEIYEGNANGSFAAPVFYPAFLNPNYVYLADLDNDGLQDIVSPDGNGFSVLKANGDGTFAPYELFLSMPSPNSLAIEDFNADGELDVVVPSAYFGSGLIGMNINCNTTGIGEMDAALTSIAVYPNPAGDDITIKYKLAAPADVGLEITDVSGKIIIGQKKVIAPEGDNIYTFSLKGQSAGIYLLKLSVHGAALSKQFIKAR